MAGRRSEVSNTDVTGGPGLLERIDRIMAEPAELRWRPPQNLGAVIWMPMPTKGVSAILTPLPTMTWRPGICSTPTPRRKG